MEKQKIFNWFEAEQWKVTERQEHGSDLLEFEIRTPKGGHKYEIIDFTDKPEEIFSQLKAIQQSYDPGIEFKKWYGKGMGEPEDYRVLLKDCEDYQSELNRVVTEFKLDMGIR